MRCRFIQDLYGRSFDSPASIQLHVDIGHDDVKRTAGQMVTVPEESGRRFLPAKKRSQTSWLERPSMRAALRGCLGFVPMRYCLGTWACVGVDSLV